MGLETHPFRLVGRERVGERVRKKELQKTVKRRQSAAKKMVIPPLPPLRAFLTENRQSRFFKRQNRVFGISKPQEVPNEYRDYENRLLKPFFAKFSHIRSL